MATYRIFGDIYRIDDNGSYTRIPNREVIRRMQYQVPVAVPTLTPRGLYAWLAFLCFWLSVPVAYLLWATW